jgi:hypothetical protein
VFASPRTPATLVLGLLAIALVLLVPLGGTGTPASVASGSAAPSVAAPATASTVHSAGPFGPAASPTLSALGQDPTGISLSWSDLITGTETFVNYSVEQASAASAWVLAPVEVITAAATVTTVVSGLAPATDYDWQVIENYETCFIGCTPGSYTTNLLNLTQPTVAFLNDSDVTSTSATLAWTNNASYGGSIDFEQYTVWEEQNRGTPTLLTTITTESARSYEATLTSGDSYTLYVLTTDCTAGCGGGSPATLTSQSNLVTIGTPEPLEVSVFASRSTIDLGQSNLFTCTPTGGESPFSYAWDFGNGTFVAGNASASAVLASTGSVIVACRVTDAEPVSNTGTAGVQVNPPLAVLASVSRTAADVGQQIGFSCAASNGTFPYTITWTLGDGTVLAVGSATHVYSAPGDFAPTCTVTDAAGAERAPSFALVVSPALDVRANASASAVAPNTRVAFTATASNGSGHYLTYNWTFVAGNGASGASAAYAFATAGTYSVAVVVADSNGASATATVDVTVSNVTVVTAVSAHNVTSGNALTFSATALGGAGGPYNYTWQFGDGLVGYGPVVSHTYTGGAATYSPRLTVTDRLGASVEVALAPIGVSGAPASSPSTLTNWLLVALVIAGIVIVALFVLERRRSSEIAQLEAASGAYVPPTDPKKTIRGSKICEFCGASNLPLRTTCSHCGKPLPGRGGA